MITIPNMIAWLLLIVCITESALIIEYMLITKGKDDEQR